MKLSFTILLSLLFSVFSEIRAQDTYRKVGWASFYHDKFEGRKTSNGEKFRQKKFTCAHRTLPFGTMLRVTNLTNNKTITVRVNDRGPYSKGRIIDLTRAGAKALDFIKEGHTRVEIEVIGDTVETDSAIVAVDTLNMKYLNDSTDIHGFSVQLGNYSRKEAVTLMAERVKRELDRSVYVQIKNIDGENSYLVSVGLFSSQNEAFEYLDKILTYYPGSFIIYLDKP